VFDAGLADEIEASAKRLGFSYRRMTSGAGHDAQMIARIAPAAMIFVPSRAGISHNPREHTDDAQLVQGAQVLMKRGRCAPWYSQDTLLRWYWELVASKWNYSHRRSPGRPRLMRTIVELTIKTGRFQARRTPRMTSATSSASCERRNPVPLCRGDELVDGRTARPLTVKTTGFNKLHRRVNCLMSFCHPTCGACAPPLEISVLSSIERNPREHRDGIRERRFRGKEHLALRIGELPILRALA
jgi:hypothetical protein